MSWDEELGPPPPYTPVDVLTPQSSLPPSSPSTGRPTSQAVELPVHTTGDQANPQTLPVRSRARGVSLVSHTPAASTASHFSSAEAYFETRNGQLGEFVPRELITHTMVVGPSTTAGEAAVIPICWQQEYHDVIEADMYTFANYLFPPHVAPQSHKERRDSKREIEESANDRVERLDAVIAEWNEGFFGPRGLKIATDFTTGVPGSFPEFCPRCADIYEVDEQDAATHPYASPQSSHPRYPTSTTGWIDRMAERFADQASRHGATIERHAQRYGNLMEQQANMKGTGIEKVAARYGRQMEELGTRFEAFLNGPRGQPWGPDHPTQGESSRRGPLNGPGAFMRGGGPIGPHFGQRVHDHHHHRGRRGGRHHVDGRRRRDESTSSSSSSSSDSDSSHDRKGGHKHGNGRTRRRRSPSTSSSSSSSSSDSSTSADLPDEVTYNKGKAVSRSQDRVLKRELRERHREEKRSERDLLRGHKRGERERRRHHPRLGGDTEAEDWKRTKELAKAEVRQAKAIAKSERKREKAVYKRDKALNKAERKREKRLGEAERAIGIAAAARQRAQEIARDDEAHRRQRQLGIDMAQRQQRGIVAAATTGTMPRGGPLSPPPPGYGDRGSSVNLKTPWATDEKKPIGDIKA